MNLMMSIKEPRFLLMYSPQRFDPHFGAVKPEGSLGLTYLAGALRDGGFNVKILDGCVGNDKYTFEQSFFRQTPLPNNMVRIGMEPEALVREVSEYDVIGISSIFTAQTAMVEEVVKLISRTYPEKLIMLGGINARSQLSRFFDAGAQLICLSEAERTVLEIGNVLRKGSRDFSAVPGVAFRHDGRIQVNPAGFVEQDLDKLPIPAWDMLPLDRYWRIARPQGSVFVPDKLMTYASVMTSRGCPFSCIFCHCSAEGEGSISGNIKKLRQKSVKRVVQEIVLLKQLGVKHIFFNDDALLVKKKRALTIFRELIRLGLELNGVNGINLSQLFVNKNGRLEVDSELLETMAHAGFRRLMFPVESGSQRIINQYASGKIDLAKYDIPLLIGKVKELGIEVASCYLIGYPDETYEEVMQTLVCAKKHIDAGVSYVNLTIATPYPGTELYQLAIQENLLLPGLDLADLDWIRPSMKTLIEPWVLEFIATKGWEFINNPQRVARIRSMAPQIKYPPTYA